MLNCIPAVTKHEGLRNVVVIPIRVVDSSILIVLNVGRPPPCNTAFRRYFYIFNGGIQLIT